MSLLEGSGCQTLYMTLPGFVQDQLAQRTLAAKDSLATQNT